MKNKNKLNVCIGIISGLAAFSASVSQAGLYISPGFNDEPNYIENRNEVPISSNRQDHQGQKHNPPIVNNQNRTPGNTNISQDAPNHEQKRDPRSQQHNHQVQQHNNQGNIVQKQNYQERTASTHDFEQSQFNPMASGETPSQGNYSMSEGDSRHQLMRYGQDVPLSIAINSIVPDVQTWTINIDEGMEKEPVNWQGGQTWENVLEIIAVENDLELFINYEESAIGISFDKETAKNMAYESPNVWRLNAEEGLRQNIERWAEKEGWEVNYSSEIGDINYSVPNTTLFGELLGQGGAIDQVLVGLNKRADIPLKAEFALRNQQIYISKLGHDKELF